MMVSLGNKKVFVFGLFLFFSSTEIVDIHFHCKQKVYFLKTSAILSGKSLLSLYKCALLIACSLISMYRITMFVELLDVYLYRC